ncbi:MAG: DUF2262 domain-containing protein [Bacteroidales bacterium]|jgi:hypothetical protein|nr:DUF2262 domain-containing protein [Bacteroidales bacterium]
MAYNAEDLRALESEYKTEEQEIVVLFGNTDGGAVKSGGELWEAQAYFLAYQDLKTGEIKKGDGRVAWAISDAESKEFGSSYPHFFKDGGIYRLRVRDLLDRTVPEGRLPSFYNRFLVVEVLEANVKNAALTAIWEDYLKPVVLKDKVFGEFTLDKHYSNFEGSLEWGGEEICVYLDVDNDDEDTWSQALEHLRSLYEQRDIKDSEFRQFAAEKLTDLANEWRENDDENEDAAEITKEDFAKRISISDGLSISADGDYSIYYDDDNMFFGHIITISGNVESGMEDADIAV